jgi:hypothetical protein
MTALTTRIFIRHARSPQSGIYSSKLDSRLRGNRHEPWLTKPEKIFLLDQALKVAMELH